MYLNVRASVLAFVAAVAISPVSAGQNPSQPNATADSGVVECRVLETHANATPAAVVVIFHQQQKQDQPRLAALIKENSGSAADIQIGSAAWTKVTVFRLKTAFGRGMFLLSPESGKLKDGDTFRIRFSDEARK